MRNFIIVFFLFTITSFQLIGQDKLANAANSAFLNLEGQNYDLSAQNFSLLINSPYYKDFSKVKSKEKKSRQRALSTFIYCRAVALANLGKYDDGLKTLEQGKAKAENPAFYTFYIGLYKDQFFDNAIDVEKVKASSKIFNDFPIVVQEYAQFLMNRGYYEEALSIYSKIVKKDKSPKDFYNAGLANEMMGETKTAKKLYQKGLDAFPIQKSPDNCTYQSLHILFLEKLGRADEALKLAKEILEINPKDYCAQKNIALLYYRTGAYDSAVETYQKLVTDNPFYENGFIHLIKSYDQMGETDRALTMLNDLLEVYPNYYDALCARAEILVKQKELDKAKVDVQKAVGLMPDHPLGKKIQNSIK